MIYSTAFYIEVYSLYAHSIIIPCGMTPAHSTLAFSDSNVESGASWKSDIGNETNDTVSH